MKGKVCRGDSKAEVLRTTFWFKPLNNEVNVQHQIAAASVFAFDDTNTVDSIVVPIELRELVEYGHAMTPNVQVQGLAAYCQSPAMRG